PTSAPTAYSTQAPTRAPRVAKAHAATTLTSPWAALKPAKGRMTSEGMGGKAVSSATRAPTPGAPIASMTSTTQPARPPSSSADSWKAKSALAGELAVLELGLHVVAVHVGDEVDRDLLRAGLLALAVVGAGAEEVLHGV